MSQDFKHNYYYSYKGLYPIEWCEIPNRIRLSNGDTRTSKEAFTEDELKDAGYAFTDIYPNYNDETHYCDWNGTKWLILEYHYVDEQDSDG
jgi:hypothetical protein|tara:strand:+ start:115 stop:387 length:273 start_codon:yes stop_codon:yes gene_type:complete